jgi:hypothetical protein
MRSPWNEIEPPSAGSTPVIRLNMVLLPAPLGPMSPRISPERMENDRWPTATRPPKRFETF